MEVQTSVPLSSFGAFLHLQTQASVQGGCLLSICCLTDCDLGLPGEVCSVTPVDRGGE